MCSQTHPRRDRKDWEMVIHMDPELFSSNCKIWRNLRTSILRVLFPSTCWVQLRPGQAANLTGQSSPITYYYPSTFPDEGTSISPKAMMVCWQEWEQWPFGIKRKFSASTFLVLESLLLSPIGPWCVNNLRLSSICVFNHMLVPKIIWLYNFPQPFIFSNWPLTVFLLYIASVVLRLGTWT